MIARQTNTSRVLCILPIPENVRSGLQKTTQYCGTTSEHRFELGQGGHLLEYGTKVLVTCSENVHKFGNDAVFLPLPLPLVLRMHSGKRSDLIRWHNPRLAVRSWFDDYPLRVFREHRFKGS